MSNPFTASMFSLARRLSSKGVFLKRSRNGLSEAESIADWCRAGVIGMRQRYLASGKLCSRARTRKSGVLDAPFSMAPLQRPLPGHPGVYFETLEPRLLLSATPLSYEAEAGTALDLMLQLTTDAGAPVFQLIDNGETDNPVIVANQALADTSQVLITGSELDDRMTFDLGLGFDLGGLLITFDAGGGSDTLVLNGGDFSTVAYTVDGADVGTIVRDGETIALAGIETFIDTTVVGERIIDLGAVADTATLENAATAGAMMLSGADENATFESIEFTNPSDSLTIRGGDGIDSITVVSSDAGFDGALTIEAENILIDTAAVIDITGDITLTASALDETTITDIADVADRTAAVTVEGDLTTSGDIAITARVTRDVVITGGSSDTTEIAAVSHAEVAIRSGAALNAANIQLAATTDGAVTATGQWWGSATNVLTENAEIDIGAATLGAANGVVTRATSTTAYIVEARNAANRISGDTRVIVDGAVITAGAGGVDILAEAASVLTAHSPELDVDVGLFDSFIELPEAVAVNHFYRDVVATVLASEITVTGGDLVLTARRSAQISASAESASLVSSEDLLLNLAITVGGTRAANTLLGDTLATIGDGTTVTITDGDVRLGAVDASVIVSNAELSQKIEIDDLFGGGISLTVGSAVAYNAIGWDTGGSDYGTSDVLLSTDIGTEDKAETLAVIRDSVISGGDLVMEATGGYRLDAYIANIAETTNDGLSGAAGMSTAGVLTTNMVSTGAGAFIEDTDAADLVETAVTLAGALSLAARDNTDLRAKAELSSSSHSDIGMGTALSTAVGGVAARNDLRSGATAYLAGLSVTLAGGDIRLEAIDNAAMEAYVRRPAHPCSFLRIIDVSIKQRATL